MTSVILLVCLLGVFLFVFGNKIPGVKSDIPKGKAQETDDFLSTYERFDSSRLQQILQLGNAGDDEIRAIKTILDRRNVPLAGVPLL